ncbi:MAG: hypothetical protein IH865_10060 [Chloroflexi bacterium]|nr:hypothetical protein [Chloroflexota bacterium]
MLESGGWITRLFFIIGSASALIAALILLTTPASAGVQPAGDANCDGSVSSLDAVIVLQVDAGLLDRAPCHAQADASFDGVVNSLDATIILQREAGLLATCRPGQTGFTASLTAVDKVTVPGEPFSLTFSVTNCNEHETTRSYSSGQIYDFIVRDDSGELVWNWAHGLAFLQAIQERTYGDRQTVTYGVVWDQTDNDGAPVPPGTYEIEAVDVGCTLPAVNECNLNATIEVQILVPPIP